MKRDKIIIISVGILVIILLYYITFGIDINKSFTSIFTNEEIPKVENKIFFKAGRINSIRNDEGLSVNKDFIDSEDVEFLINGITYILDTNQNYMNLGLVVDFSDRDENNYDLYYDEKFSCTDEAKISFKNDYKYERNSSRINIIPTSIQKLNMNSVTFGEAVMRANKNIFAEKVDTISPMNVEGVFVKDTVNAKEKLLSWGEKNETFFYEEKVDNFMSKVGIIAFTLIVTSIMIFFIGGVLVLKK